MLLLIILALGAGFLWARNSLGRPVEHDDPDRIVTVDPGSGLPSVIAKLHDAGIVEHPLLLRAYLVVTRRESPIKAGDYKFPSPISPLQAIERVRRGDMFIQRVTIPEGYNKFEIAEVLSTKTGKATPDEILQMMDDTTLISGIAPEATSLEGYLFPDTYSYTAKTSPEEIIRSMVRRFLELFTPDMVSLAAQRGLSVHKAVTLASIIEKEARVPEDRALISSVMYNRLAIGMPLAADPTFIYAAIREKDYDGNPNQPRHRRRMSPYNTYLYPGLPPGPIASPGRASIEAALHPASTAYLYYVVNTAEGKHKFSRTAAEHEAAVAEYHRLRDQQKAAAGGGGR